MIMLCLVFGAILAMQACIRDSDCMARSRLDVHSMFCVDNVCQKIIPAGGHCIVPTDCASYPFFGPLACTEKCGIEKECTHEPQKGGGSTYCCKSVPVGKSCNPNRPRLVSGCGTRQSCLLGRSGAYECSLEKSNSWATSVVLSISGNICINLGINLHKRSYRTSEVLFLGLKLRTFRAGCLIYGFGKIFGYCSYIFGNQSLIAALSATGLVSNSILAPMINGEVFTWKDCCAILFVFAGSTMVIINTNGDHMAYTLCELMKMYKNVWTLLWFGFIFFTIIVLFFVVKYVELNSNWELPEETMMFLKRDSVWFEEDSITMKYLMVLAYVWLSSFIASFTTLSVKSLGEIIDKTVSGENQFVFLATYAFIFILSICTLLQIYWLNRALRHYDALLVIPIFHVSWTLLSIFTAGIYFQEFEQYTAEQLKVFFFGVGIIFIGSFFLGSRITDKNRISTQKVDIKPRITQKNRHESRNTLITHKT